MIEKTEDNIDRLAKAIVEAMDMDTVLSVAKDVVESNLNELDAAAFERAWNDNIED
jgi:hypothetical protein